MKQSLKKDARMRRYKQIVTLCVEALKPWQESEIIRAEMGRAIARALIKGEKQ
jgi:hypothetical protein